MTPLVLILVLSAAPTEAERLFAEGRAKFKAEKVAEACRLFERSQQLEPALGTLLNLGICLETEGRLASAYVKLNEALAWAARTHEAAREELVRTHLKAVRPRLSFITVKAEKPVPSMVLTVEGLDLPLGTGPQTLPVDPGPIALKVTAPGYVAWAGEAKTPPEGQTEQVTVPALTADPKVAPVAAAPVDAPFARPTTVTPAVTPEAPTPAAAKVTAPSPAPPGARAGAIAGIVVGSAVAVAGAAGLGWSYSTNAALIAQQPGGPQANSPTVTREQFETMKWLYPASWAAVGVGLATLGVSAYFALRPEPSAAVSLVPTPGGAAVSLSGRF